MSSHNCPLATNVQDGSITSSVESSPWYAIRTKSNFERLASTVLQSKGYEPYLPEFSERRRWSDRTVSTDRPLFPGYFFCRFDAAERRPIITTPGVVSIVGFGNEPAPISDGEIEAIQTVLRSGLPARPCAYLHEGQRVRIRCGALEGLEGILVRQKTTARMIVSVEMLQRSITVEVDEDWIEAAPEAKPRHSV